MARKFKGKKNKNNVFKYILWLLIIYLFYSLVSFLILNIKLVDNNEEFIEKILSDSNYHMLYEKKSNNTVYKLTKLLTNLNIKEPITILENNFGYKLNNSTELVYNEDYINTNEIERVIGYMNKEVSTDPIVYIYNSHQTEGYSNEYLEGYNITPNVLMASYLLKDKLEKLNIPTLVEESNIPEFMRINNWVHKDSYKASRFYLLDTINKYSSVKLYIDLHRDAVSKEDSTVTINNKKYAKVLFVVGKEHDNYKKNLILANNLNNKITKKYSTLSKGIVEKEGSGVNGIYNQDLSENCVLIELGGYENNISEVLNTIEILSEIIKEHLNERNET